jgi:tetratricopeptide (TPR) repeat protein
LVARATELDPGFAAPHGLAAFCYASRKTNGWMVDRIWETQEAGRRARSAAQLGSEDAVALAFAAYALSYVDHELEDAVVLVDRAVALNPNLAFAWLTSGLIRAYRPGEQDVGIGHVGRAMGLSPFDSHMHLMHAVLAFVHSVAGRHDEAVAWGERALAANPRMSATWRVVAANHAHAGRLAPARNAVARVLELDPGARLSNLEDRVGPQSPAFFASYLEGLRKAGLPE